MQLPSTAKLIKPKDEVIRGLPNITEILPTSAGCHLTELAATDRTVSRCNSAASKNAEEEDFYKNVPIPKLRYPTKVPNVKWQQNKAIVCLIIEAADLQNYYLRLTNRSLHYWYVCLYYFLIMG